MWLVRRGEDWQSWKGMGLEAGERGTHRCPASSARTARTRSSTASEGAGSQVLFEPRAEERERVENALVASCGRRQ